MLAFSAIERLGGRITCWTTRLKAADRSSLNCRSRAGANRRQWERHEREHLIVEDDDTLSAALLRALKRRDHAAVAAKSAATALSQAREHAPDRIVLDLNLAGESGLNLIPLLLEINPACRIVVLTGYASITTAVDAIKLGAVQYLAKPVDVATLLAAFDHALEAGES